MWVVSLYFLYRVIVSTSKILAFPRLHDDPFQMQVVRILFGAHVPEDGSRVSSKTSCF